MDVRSDARLAPRLFVSSGSEVLRRFYTDPTDALRGALHAERLGFGWRLDAYDAPISDTEFQREWRLAAWKQVRSERVIDPHAEMTPVDRREPAPLFDL